MLQSDGQSCCGEVRVERYRITCTCSINYIVKMVVVLNCNTECRLYYGVCECVVLPHGETCQ